MINIIDKTLWPEYQKELMKNFNSYFNADMLYNFLRENPTPILDDAVIKVLNYSFVRMKLDKTLKKAGFSDNLIDEKLFKDYMKSWGVTHEDTTKRLFINEKFAQLLFRELNNFLKRSKIILYSYNGNPPYNQMWTESFNIIKSTEYPGEYELVLFDTDYADFEHLEILSKHIDFIKLK